MQPTGASRLLWEASSKLKYLRSLKNDWQENLPVIQMNK